MRKLLLVIAAIAVGLAIAYLDSRPGWDDTGLTVASLVATSAFFGLLSPRRPWIWALAVGLWIPLFGIVLRRDLMMLITLIFPLVGAYLGAAVRLLVRRVNSPSR